MSNIYERGTGIRWRCNRIYAQNFEVLQKQCLNQKVLFTDPEFHTSDLFLHFKNIQKHRFEWRRPSAIAKNPQFFVEGASRFDVNQGILENCWLVASLASLTLNKELFYQVVPNDQGFDNKYAGIFHFKFWQFGRWVDVVIDDRLPTSNGKLIFLRSTNENEFWSALLEKAYAKIYGSYEALKYGFSLEALVDFTGGISEMYPLKEAPSNLFTTMLDSFQRKSIMCCSIFEPESSDTTDKGLFVPHTYSITQIRYVTRTNSTVKIPLIRLRNPCGKHYEWNGPWNDNSDEWSSIRNSVDLTIEDDGEFWIAYEDFFKYFSALEMCHLTPDDIDREQYGTENKNKWDLSIFEGEWTRATTPDTISSNPQYYITLEDPDDNDDENMCTVIISVMLKNIRRNRAKGAEPFQIGFQMYNLNKSESMTRPLDMDFFEKNTPIHEYFNYYRKFREASNRISVAPGKYCIVPCTYEKNKQGAFLLRVYSEKKNNLAELDNEVGAAEIDYKIKELALNNTNKIKLSSEKLKKYFFKKALSDSEVDWMDLKNILEYAMKQEFGKTQFSNDVYRCMIAMMDWDRSGKLSFQEFQRLWVDIRHWRAVFITYDLKKNGYINGSELKLALSSAGYHIKTRTVNTMYNRYANKKGYIMFEDYIMCVIRLKTMIEIFKERDSDNKNVSLFTLEEWVDKTFYS